jgi:hypothetical protein
MADHPDESSDEIMFAEDFPTSIFPIYPAGEAGSFHTRNDPGGSYQRDTIIQRRDRVDIRCEHKDIVHGFGSTESDDLYSLIVMEFRFDPNRIAARIKEARVTIQFSAMDVGKVDPEVMAMSPNGSFVVEPTTQHEQVVTGAGGHLGGGAVGVQVGGELRVESRTERDREDFTRLRGSIDLLRDYGRNNAVSWTLLENPTAKTGVLSRLQGAILLKRASMKPFKARVTIRAVADTRSRISSLFHKDPKDDDVWYHPDKNPTNRLRQYDVDNLGAVDLQSLSDVTLRTVLTHTIKEQ